MERSAIRGPRIPLTLHAGYGHYESVGTRPAGRPS
jgi:hypothetical protein